jgi:ABC-2 type transport system ATP-binding protein
MIDESPDPHTESTAGARVSSVADTADVITETIALQPAVSTDPAPQNAIELVTTALSSAVVTVLNPSAGDAPPGPVESPAMWALAAAARREFTEATPRLEQAANPVTNSLTTGATLAATQAPAVVAVEQTAPLAFLQQLPVIGPTLVTPIVAVVHQIPFLSDVLHPFIGYPMQFGLPAGTPVPRDFFVTSFDGTPINVHFMPAVGLQAGQRAPTILSGPGLTMPSATNLHGTPFDDFITDTFGSVGVGTLRHAGYNVVTWDPRGEWFSGGVLELNSPEFEGRDVSAIISWLATRPEVRVDGPGDPRIGMVGPSYGGGIQLVTASIDGRVDAIVPSVTYHSLTTALYRNEAFRSSWGTLLSAALVGTGARINPRILPAAVTGLLTGTVSQADRDLLAARNPVVGNITAPTLLIHGTVDTVFSVQEAMDNAQALVTNGVPTKMLWFCGGHGVCLNNLTDLSDGALIEQRTIEWLDRYVKGDLSVSTGPQFAWVDQKGQWLASDLMPFDPDFRGDPITAARSGAVLPLVPIVGGSGIPLIPLAFPAINAVNLTVPATTTTHLVGAPELTLTYSGAGSSRHVYAQLVDDTTGLVLGGIATPIPVTLDGRTHTVTIPLEPVAHTLAPGQTVTLQLVASAALYTIVTSPGVLNVSNMQLALPTADPAAVTSSSAAAMTLAA